MKKIVHLAGRDDARGYTTAACVDGSRPLDDSSEEYTFLSDEITCPECQSISKRDGCQPAD